jgi:hypothetical protein
VLLAQAWACPAMYSGVTCGGRQIALHAVVATQLLPARQVGGFRALIAWAARTPLSLLRFIHSLWITSFPQSAGISAHI